MQEGFRNIDLETIVHVADFFEKGHPKGIFKDNLAAVYVYLMTTDLPI